MFDKVFPNEELVFGVSGHVRHADVIRFAKLPKIKATDKDTHKWVVNTLVPAMIGALRSAVSVEVSNEQVDASWGMILWARGEVFDVGADFSAIPIEEYVSVGSGSRFAYPALDLGVSARKAVKVAKGRDIYSGGKTNSVIVEVV